MALPAKERFKDVLEIHLAIPAQQSGMPDSITYRKRQLTYLGINTKDITTLDTLPEGAINPKRYIYTDNRGNLYDALIYSTNEDKLYLAAIKSIPEK